MYEDDYTLKDQMVDPIIFLVANNKDTLYYHQAIKTPNRDKFLIVMYKYFDSHIDKKYYELIDHGSVTERGDVFDDV